MDKNLIYKYVSFEDALKTIENNCVVLNNSVNYNDPFDCQLDFDRKDEDKTIELLIEVFLVKEFFKIINNKQIKFKWHQKPIIFFVRNMFKFVLWATKKQHYYVSNPIYNLLVKRLLKNPDMINKSSSITLDEAKHEFINVMLPQLKELRNTALISCFSKENNSILMWGHYANKHSGVCIGFERPKDNFYDVSYSKKRVAFPLYELACIICSYIMNDEEVDINNQNILKKGLRSFLTKSIDWSYEKEVRCIFSLKELQNANHIGEGRYLYEMPTKIKTINLSCKISEQDKDTILNIAKEKKI